MLPKLVIIFVLFSFASAGAMIWIVSKGLDEGFLEYVNQREQTQVLDIKADLESLYSESGNWALFQKRDGDSQWDQFLETFIGTPRARARANNRIATSDDSAQEQRLPNQRELRVQSGPRAREALRQGGFDRDLTEVLQIAIQNRLRRLQSNSLISRIRLVDAGGLIVAGKQQAGSNARTYPLEYMGQSVGQMTVDRIALLQGEYELSYQADQRRWLYIAALVLLLCSAMMAWGVGRHFLTPVNRLAKGTKALASGELGMQIAGDRKDELGELIVLFNQLSSELKASKSTRDQWVADIAHELRTPLSIMRGEIEALQDGTRKVSKKALNSLKEEIYYLSRLVNDLYELSLSDAGGLKYQFRPCDLAELVQGVVESFSGNEKSSDLTVTFDNEIDATTILSLDEDRIAQLLSNLLVNSSRYTNKPGVIVVRLAHHVAGDKAGIELSVADSSPGVDEENLPHLFDRLYRVEKSRNRATGGAGIGLAICKNIAEAHGGTITAQPSELGGLTVIVRFPNSLAIKT